MGTQATLDISLYFKPGPVEYWRLADLCAVCVQNVSTTAAGTLSKIADAATSLPTVQIATKTY